MGRRPERNTLINFVFFRVLSEFLSLSREALRASLRLVSRELIERVIIVRDLLCTQQTPRAHALSRHRRRAVFFFTKTLCKSFKVHCVAQILQMALFRDSFKPAPSGSTLPVSREEELLAWQADVCKGLGLPWPPPKATAGKPSRQALWLRAIDAEVRAGRTLPDGDSLTTTGVSNAEVCAGGELAKCEAVDQKRRRTAIDPDVKDWFLDNHECMKVKHKWIMMQSWRRAH